MGTVSVDVKSTIVPTKHTLVYEWDIYKCRLCTNKLANKIAIFF